MWADGQPTQGPLHISPKLSKSGEQIALSQSVSGNVTILDSLTFGAQTDDVSVGRSTDGGNTFKNFVVPTPGSSNVVTFRSGLYINEFLAVNQSSITDENGEHDGWIEIYNNNNTATNIGGLYLTNDLSNPSLWKIPANQPSLTTIPAKGFIILWADNQQAQGALHLGFKLNATGGEIGLTEIIGTDMSTIDSSPYGSQTADVSLGRYPDAGKYFKSFAAPTPGSANLLPAISNIYINEFLAGNQADLVDEAGEHDDWIELYNANATPVDVGGLFITDDLTKPNKYQIPTTNPGMTTIPAKGFLLLWADDQAQQGVLHVGIKLSVGGEQIGLAQTNGTNTNFIDSYSFGAQTNDISTGRSPDGGSNFITFTKTTPGASNVINNPPTGIKITSLTLINAVTDQDIMELTNGAKINVNDLTTLSLNVRANITTEVKSVGFSLTGALTKSQTENVAPYALYGDNKGDYNGQTFKVGSYTLVATPFAGSNKSGQAGPALTITFELVNQVAKTTMTNARTLSSAVAEGKNETFLEGSAVAYPNPVIDGRFKVQFAKMLQGKVSYVLISQAGTKLSEGQVNLKEATSSMDFDLSNNRLNNEVYYLILSDDTLEKPVKVTLINKK